MRGWGDSFVEWGVGFAAIGKAAVCFYYFLQGRDAYGNFCQSQGLKKRENCFPIKLNPFQDI
jgi:hypothetical protein